MRDNEEKCPWCDSEISREKFQEVSGKIRQQEKEKLAEREVAIRRALEEKFAKDVQAKCDAAAQAERLRAATELKQAKDALAKATQEQLRATKTAEAALANEEKLKQQLQKEAEKERKREIAEQRDLLEREHQRELSKVRTEYARETEKVQKKIEALERQIKKQTSNELGEGGEVDLFEKLREEFPDDKVRRVPKGEAGADVHQQVIYKGEVCGLIIADSKNRMAWQRNFATKLREDQVAANADHAILTTTVFPAGRKELCIEEGVIVVNPLRAVYVVNLLRTALIKMHTRGLSLKEREGKMEELYQWITSEPYAQKLNDALRMTGELLELDVQEQKEHQNVWKKRGRLSVKLRDTLRDIESEASAIVEGNHEGILVEAGSNDEDFFLKPR
jgi:hypothetical protein